MDMALRRSGAADQSRTFRGRSHGDISETSDFKTNRSACPTRNAQPPSTPAYSIALTALRSTLAALAAASLAARLPIASSQPPRRLSGMRQLKVAMHYFAALAAAFLALASAVLVSLGLHAQEARQVLEISMLTRVRMW